MTTLRHIYNQAQSVTPPANLLTIPASADLTDISTEYTTNHAEIDRYFVRQFYNFAFLDFGYNPPTVADALSGLQTLASDELTVNTYKWSKLYDTTQLQYNPLYNVDGKTVEEHDMYTDTNKYPARSDSVTHSKYPFDDSTNAYAESKDDMSFGLHNDQYEHGKQKITTTRTGNIGVTMSQQMLQSERDVVNWSFWDVFLKELIMKSFVVGLEV